MNPPKSSGAGAPISPAKLPPRATRDTRLAAIVAVIEASGLPPRQAALSTGMSSSAWYRMAEDPAVVEAIDEATAIFARQMAAVIARAAAGLGSWKAAQFWLERRLGEYGPRALLTVHDERVSMEDELAETLTPEDLEAKLDSLAAEAVRRLSSERLEEILVDRRRRDVGSQP